MGTVEHRREVRPVVHRQVRAGRERLVNVPVIGVAILPPAREHGEVHVLDQGGRDVILRGKRVAGAQRQRRAPGLQGAHEVCGLGRHVQAGGDPDPLERPLAREPLPNQAEHGHLGVGPADALPPLSDKGQVLDIRLHHSLPPDARHPSIAWVGASPRAHPSLPSLPRPPASRSREGSPPAEPNSPSSQWDLTSGTDGGESHAPAGRLGGPDHADRGRGIHLGERRTWRGRPRGHREGGHHRLRQRRRHHPDLRGRRGHARQDPAGDPCPRTTPGGPRCDQAR